MSYTVNGVGTQIYGQQRLLTHRGKCEFCGANTDLQSYDGTNYFVICFIPIFPLGKLRLLDHCSVCQRWHQLKMKDWEQQKEKALSNVLARLKTNSHDLNAINDALETSTSFQDESILLQFKDLAADFPQNAKLQLTLANCLSTFSRHDEAVEACQRALATHDCQSTREQLAVELLRLKKAARAEAHLSHIWSGDDPNLISLGILLVEGYQAVGDHEAVMSRLDRLEQTYPQLVEDKEFQKFRKKAAKHQRNGTVVRETTLVSKSKKGFDHKGDPATIAVYIAPVLAVLALTLYGGCAAWKGRNQEVFLVNGLDQAYTATINGKSLSLDANSWQKISLNQGDVVVSVADQELSIPELTVRIQTPFISRPFANRTFVLNPDRSALIANEEVLYGENVGERDLEYQIAVGQPFYEFTGIDYVFQEAPDTVTVENGFAVRDVLRHVDTSQWTKLEIVDELLSFSGPEVTQEYLWRRLKLNADSPSYVAGLKKTMTAAEYLDLVKSRLDAKPTQVAWHRVHQDTMQRDEPEYDLRQEYRTRFQNDPSDSALLYLLARTTLRPSQRLDLLRQAINARPVVSYAYHGMALEHLANGRFKDGISQLRKALELSPDNELFRETQRDLFVADGQYEFALAKYREAKGSSIMTKLNLLASRLSILAAMGDAETAQQEIVQVMRDAGGELPQDVADVIGNAFKEKLAYALQDWQAYRSLHPDPSAENSPFYVLVTLRKYQDASTLLVDESTEEEYDGLASLAANHLLLYIAGTDIGDSELASKHLDKATELLNKTGLHGRMVAQALTTGKANVTTLTGYLAPPSVKRIVMVACAKRFPAEASEYAAMAQKLNFELTFPRWFLESALN